MLGWVFWGAPWEIVELVSFTGEGLGWTRKHFHISFLSVESSSEDRYFYGCFLWDGDIRGRMVKIVVSGLPIKMCLFFKWFFMLSLNRFSMISRT